MTYAIIGFGSIGQALAKAFARNSVKVFVATSKDPESLASTAATIGPTIIPQKLNEAVKAADIIFLAVRFEKHQDVAKTLSNWQGKIIIDVTNTQVDPKELDGQASSKFVEQSFTGAKLVKGFNHLGATKLGQDPTVNGGKRAIFLASDDNEAISEVSLLAEKLGFAPILLGGLSEGGLLVQAKGPKWGPLIFKDLIKV